MNSEVKKEFQKVVAHIRAERNKSRERKSEYPKAMMTGQQMKKRTATVNCCGNKTLVAEVAAHPDFIAFIAEPFNNICYQFFILYDHTFGHFYMNEISWNIVS